MKTHLLILVFCILLGFSINDNPDSNVGLSNLLTMNTEKPFVYRVLVPQVGNGLAWLVGVDAKIIVRIIGSFLFFGAFLACQKLVDYRHTALLWAASILFLMVINHVRVYAYDPLTLFSFTLCYLMLVRQSWRGFVLAFILATVNRETTFLLIAFFAVYQYGKPHYYRRLVSLVLIFAIIRLISIYLFWSYPGSNYQTHYTAFLDALQGMPVRFIVTYGLILALAALMLYRLKSVSPFVRAGILAVYWPSVFLMALFGNPFEIRVLLEAQPIIILTLANSAAFHPAY